MSFICGHALGGHVLHALGQLVEVALHQLLAQLVHELLELLTCRVVHELVLLHRLHAAGEIGRHLLELPAPLLGDVLDQLLAALVARACGVVDPPVDAFALHVDDLVELFGDVVVHAAQVVVLELLPAPFAAASRASRAGPSAARCSGRGSPAASSAATPRSGRRGTGGRRSSRRAATRRRDRSRSACRPNGSSGTRDAHDDGTACEPPYRFAIAPGQGPQCGHASAASGRRPGPRRRRPHRRAHATRSRRCRCRARRSARPPTTTTPTCRSSSARSTGRPTWWRSSPSMRRRTSPTTRRPTST